MKTINKYMMAGSAALALLALSTLPSQGMEITVDEILAPGDVDASELYGEVTMSLVANVLTITLQNTSTDAAGSGAGVLLTGIGFVLPDGVTISSGSASMLGSTAVGFTAPLLGDVSEEWGYDDGGIESGALMNAQQTVNTAVSSMESQATSQFQPGSIAQPVNLDGPDFGLVSALEQDDLGSGVEGIEDSITITLLLSGTLLDLGLLEEIEDGWVVLTFGSPGSGGTSVPDASTSLMLLGLAMVGIEGARRKFAKV